MLLLIAIDCINQGAIESCSCLKEQAKTGFCQGNVLFNNHFYNSNYKILSKQSACMVK